MNINNFVKTESEAIKVLNDILSYMKLNLKEYARDDENTIEEVLRNLHDFNGLYHEDENSITVCVDFLCINREDGLYAVDFGAKDGIWLDVKIDRETMTVIDFDFDYAVECVEMNK